MIKKNINNFYILSKRIFFGLMIAFLVSVFSITTPSIASHAAVPITKTVDLVYVFSTKDGNSWSKEQSFPVKLTANENQTVSVKLPTFRGYTIKSNKAKFTLVNGFFVQDTQVVYLQDSNSHSTTNLTAAQLTNINKNKNKNKNKSKSNKDSKNKAPNDKYLKNKKTDKKMLHVGKKPTSNKLKEESDDPQTGRVKQNMFLTIMNNIIDYVNIF